MNDILDELKGFEMPGLDVSEVQSQLDTLTNELNAALVEKCEVEGKLSLANDRVKDLQDKIKDVWGPYIKNTSSAKLKTSSGLELSAVKIQTISQEDNDQCMNWLMENGYKDAMKYSIHHKTFEKIAKENYQSGTMIPGAKYSSFTKIAVK